MCCESNPNVSPEVNRARCASVAGLVIGCTTIVVGLIALGLLVADFMIERHAYKPVTFSLFPMFYGLYGFSAFAFVVVCGWPLGKLLRRDENFYEDQDIDGSDASDDEEGA